MLMIEKIVYLGCLGLMSYGVGYYLGLKKSEADARKEKKE